MQDTNPFGFDLQWYEIWMKQSKQFFETANQQLNDLFSRAQTVNPDEHVKEIQQWLTMMKSQWYAAAASAEPHFRNYTNTMVTLCSSAADAMFAEWKQKFNQGNPVKDIRELYELWLDCCQAEYKKTLKTAAFQNAYSDMLNSTFKYWQSMSPRK